MFLGEVNVILKGEGEKKIGSFRAATEAEAVERARAICLNYSEKNEIDFQKIDVMKPVPIKRIERENNHYFSLTIGNTGNWFECEYWEEEG